MTRNQLTNCKLQSSNLDFSPLFSSMIGFDRLAQMLDAQTTSANTYPPYNIEKTDDKTYRITMAVAGFTRDEIDITAEQGTLIISGQKTDDAAQNGRTYLHRGIAARAFEQRFQLADHVEVKDAKLEHGLLTIELLHEVPERLKPKKIQVKAN